MGVPPREALRSKEPLARELALSEAGDDEILAAMAAHPVLVERPIVVTVKGAALCRPPERLADLL